MRRVLGLIILLNAIFLAYVVRHPHALPTRDPNELALPTRIALKIPNPVRVAGVAGLVGLAMFLWPASRPKFATIECPGCGKSLQKGRRNCPFCKTELVKY